MRRKPGSRAITDGTDDPSAISAEDVGETVAPARTGNPVPSPELSSLSMLGPR